MTMFCLIFIQYTSEQLHPMLIIVYLQLGVNNISLFADWLNKT